MKDFGHRSVVLSKVGSVFSETLFCIGNEFQTQGNIDVFGATSTYTDNLDCIQIKINKYIKTNKQTNKR